MFRTMLHLPIKPTSKFGGISPKVNVKTSGNNCCSVLDLRTWMDTEDLGTGFELVRQSKVGLDRKGELEMVS